MRISDACFFGRRGRLGPWNVLSAGLLQRRAFRQMSRRPSLNGFTNALTTRALPPMLAEYALSSNRLLGAADDAERVPNGRRTVQ